MIDEFSFRQQNGSRAPGLRLDADDTVFFLRQLESIDAKPYQVLFSGMLARRYIPNQEGVDPTSNVYTWRMYERKGIAKASTGNANDLPRVGVVGGERSVTIKQIETSYGWTVREIQQAAKVGTPLDQMTVNAARRAVDFEVDSLLAFGSTELGILGLYNLPNVNSSTASTKNTGGKDWTPTTTPSEMLGDLNLLINELRAGLKQAGDESVMWPKFVILSPSHDYGIMASTPRSDISDTTILAYAIQNNPWIESIEEWWRGDDAGGASTPVHVAFPRDPDAVSAVVPIEFTSLPPQAEGLGYVIPAYGSCGGVVNRYPVAVRYIATH